MKKKVIITISWVLVVIWMGVIFCFSSVNATKSVSDSRKIIEKTIEKTVETTNKTGLTDKHPSKEKIEDTSIELDYPFRKGMHITVFIILVLLVLNALYQSGVRNKLLYILGILISVIYSCSDEYHQLFTERTGEIKDVFIDSIGIILGTILYKLGFVIYNKKIKSIKSN